MPSRPSSSSSSPPAASVASARLSQLSATLGGAEPGVWHSSSSVFPTRRQLPAIPGAPAGAAWFWGKDDNLGRVNLLTPERVKSAADEEIRSGDVVPVNLPLNVPNPPFFGREEFRHEILGKRNGRSFDDRYDMNTQSGTQWDGFRHFSHLPTGTFYNNTKASDIKGAQPNLKSSIHHIASHGLAGRGILLDYYAYHHSLPSSTPYDPFAHHAISLHDLFACGAAQGIDLRPVSQGGDVRVGDMLFVRSGFVQRYLEAGEADKKALAGREKSEWAGVAQGDEMLDWLHDCYFAAVAGDAPAFEAWPTARDYHLHEHLLALWGVPIGEMLDLERLSEKCRERKRWNFFFTSSPANCPGGVASHVNGLAIL